MKSINLNGLSMGGNGNSIYAGNLLFGSMGMKSTQEKLERMQQSESKVAFWENQKELLKSRECGTVEEIARKLEDLHTYEDQIHAAKMAYNYEQMRHVMDEAKELGEKLAEAAEKMEPKTPEERKKEAAKEAAEAVARTDGEDGGEGLLDEMLDEDLKSVEELEAEMAEETLQEMDEQAIEQLAREYAEKEAEKIAESTGHMPSQGETEYLEALKRMSIDIRV